QGRAHVAQMQQAGWARRETGLEGRGGHGRPMVAETAAAVNGFRLRRLRNPVRISRATPLRSPDCSHSRETLDARSHEDQLRYRDPGTVSGEVTEVGRQLPEVRAGRFLR